MAKKIHTGERKQRTIQQRLSDIVPLYVAKYIIWKFDDNKDKESFEEFRSFDKNHVKTEEICDTWLTRVDGQEALQLYFSLIKKYNMMKIYNKMLELAVEGDVKAASWVQNFTKSEFLQDDEDDEMNKYLANIDIPALKGE